MKNEFIENFILAEASAAEIKAACDKVKNILPPHLTFSFNPEAETMRVPDSVFEQDPVTKIRHDLRLAGATKVREFQGSLYAEFPKFDVLIVAVKGGRFKMRVYDHIKTLSLFCNDEKELYTAIKKINDFSFFCTTPLLLDMFAEAIQKGEVTLDAAVLFEKTSKSLIKPLSRNMAFSRL